jgi:hypothetical protein
MERKRRKLYLSAKNQVRRNTKNTCSSTPDSFEATEFLLILSLSLSLSLFSRSPFNDQTLSHDDKALTGVEPSPEETLTARRQSDPRSQSFFSSGGVVQWEEQTRRPLP